MVAVKTGLALENDELGAEKELDAAVGSGGGGGGAGGGGGVPRLMHDPNPSPNPSPNPNPNFNPNQVHGMEAKQLSPAVGLRAAPVGYG